MLGPEDFHTPPFRIVAMKLKEAVEGVRDEAVMHLVETPQSHPERIGRLRGLAIAAQILKEVERELLGLDEKAKP